MSDQTSWWKSELEAHWGKGESGPETRRAAKTALGELARIQAEAQEARDCYCRLWEDFSRLQAENERLRAAITNADAKLKAAINWEPSRDVLRILNDVVLGVKAAQATLTGGEGGGFVVSNPK